MIKMWNRVIAENSHIKSADIDLCGTPLSQGNPMMTFWFLGAMDTFARALKAAARIKTDGHFTQLIKVIFGIM